MYSNKQSVNILTSLLVAHGVKHAVVCPGSRNVPIVHNLNECPYITCHPVTDERSAGFFALGIAQATDEPVAVCVTSGTALLNLTPAVAEAHYQHQSLIVISADRPAPWIDQLDGQTLLQPGALEPWVKKTVSLPEVDPAAPPLSAWHCNRLVNEALIEATDDTRPCVHINVPLSEPLFDFTTHQLPVERVIRRFSPAIDYSCLPQQLIDDLTQAERPLIVFGQLSSRRFHYEGVDHLFSHVIVLHEAPAPFTSVSLIDDALSAAASQFLDLSPDFILHVGDAIVSKLLKQFLRQATDARTWRISLTGDVEDTFQNLCGIVTGDAEAVLQALNKKLSACRLAHVGEQRNYRRQWLGLLRNACQRLDSTPLSFSEEGAVRLLEQHLAKRFSPLTSQFARPDVHYANSTAIRLANRFAQGHPVWCNRGTNGIEGSLSTAVGFAAAKQNTPQPPTFCVIGDLSFFYDQNALWNTCLSHINLRILLLNNGHGAIFFHLPGLSQSPAADRLIAARHHTTAEGICLQHGVAHRSACNIEQLHQGIQWLADDEASPSVRLLEVRLSSCDN